MTPGPAAMGFGEVWHRRNVPTEHQFTYRVNQIWIDPDRPQDLFDRHPLWSCRRPSPIRFRRRDYFEAGSQPIGPGIRDRLTEALGRRPEGPVRMLTQPRTWGWLFNPITVYLVWDAKTAEPGGTEADSHDPVRAVADSSESNSAGQPVGAVLEVTNTPWKERITYPMALDDETDRLVARFDKRLHVSPFLDEDHLYELAVIKNDDPRNFEMSIDVYRKPETGINTDHKAVVETRLRLRLDRPTGANMTSALYRNPAPTHRVSLGIHLQAARLLKKRVPFVSHPKRRS